MESLLMKGMIEVYRVKLDGTRELIYKHSNTINSTLQSNLRNVLINRSVNYGVDAMAEGSFSAPGGTFLGGDYAGTTGFGTKGALIMTPIGSNQAKFSGTFSFGSTTQVNYYSIGVQYAPAAPGVGAQFVQIYAYDNSLLTGSTWLTFANGESQILDWTLQIGA